jgi:hypothetical protein
MLADPLMNAAGRLTDGEHLILNPVNPVATCIAFSVVRIGSRPGMIASACPHSFA